MNDILQRLEQWVEENYKPYKCSWTAERSMGNYDDCFEDGADSQRSWDAYEIGGMLGMKLEEPEVPSYE